MFDTTAYESDENGVLTAQVERAPERWPLPKGPASIGVVLSQPRLCFTDQTVCLSQALVGMPNTMVYAVSGFPWDKALSQGISAVVGMGVDYLVFADYDGLFTKSDLATLINAMQAHPEYGAIYPIQAHRHKDGALVEDPKADYDAELTETEHAHFGLTVIRRQVFELMPEPWFWSMPNPVTNTWAAGSIDADIFFWKQCRQVGVRVARHNKVHIGHMELCSFWLDKDGKRIYQTIQDYRKHGKPKEAVWEGPRSVVPDGVTLPNLDKAVAEACGVAQ